MEEISNRFIVEAVAVDLVEEEEEEQLTSKKLQLSHSD